jgi:YVTN family beta-propeller protein
MPRTKYFSRWLMLLSGVLMLAAGGCGGSSSSPAASASFGRSFKSGGIYPEGIGIDNADHVWVANRYSNNVVELSSGGEILNIVAVGARPHGLKIDRGNTENIWVQNTASNDVTAIGADVSVIGTFPTGGTEPQHAQFDPGGNIWVTNQGSNTVAELDTSGAIVQQVSVGQNPHAIARDSDGNFWIGNYSSGNITVLDATGALVTTIGGVGYQPTGNAIDPGQNLWQSVQSIDQVVQFAAGPGFDQIANPAVGVGPRGISIDNVGDVFVANQRTNDVYKLNPSGSLVAHYRVGACPENMAIDSRGNLWVTDACDNTVTRLTGVAVPIPSGDGDSNG